MSDQPGALTRAMRRFGYRKDVDRLLREARHEGGLAKTLEARDLVVLGVAGIIGAGIFVLIGQGIQLSGLGVVPAFLVSAAICAVAGLAYAELASTIPASGSAYAYIYTALGEFPGWLVAWALVLEYAIGAVSVAVGWRNNLLALINQFKDSDPTTDIFSTKAQYWWTHSPFEHVSLADGTVLHGIINIPSVIIVLLCTALLIKGTKESAKFTTVLVVIKVSILLLAIVGGFLAFNAVNFHDPYPHSLADDPNTVAAGDAVTVTDTRGFLGNIQAIFAAGAIMFFAYIGFDSVSTTAEETKDPKRDMPRGILGSLAIVAVLYVLAALALASASNWTQYVGNSVAATNRRGEPFGYLFEQHHFLQVGGFGLGALLVRIGALIGTTSVLLVLILGGVRVFFNMSRDGLLPNWLASISKTGTPAKGTAFYGAFTAVFASLLTLGNAVNLVNIGTLFAFFMVILSVWAFRLKRPDIERPFRMNAWTVRGPMAWAALALLFALGIGLLFAVGLKGTVLLVLGIIMLGLFAAIGMVLRRRKELPALVILGLLGTFTLSASLDHFTLKASLLWAGIGLLLYAFYSIPRSKEAHHIHVPGGGEPPALTTGVTHEADLMPDAGRTHKASGRAHAEEVSYTRPTLRGGDVDVIDLEGVGPVFAKHLTKAGYHTAYQLRDADAAEVASKAKVPEGDVRHWQAMTTLLPVNGIGPQFAEALVRSGVKSLQDLAGRNPEALAKTVHKHLESKDVTIVGQPVTETRAAAWVADAKRLSAKAPKTVITPGSSGTGTASSTGSGYRHHGYTLYRRDIETSGGATRPLYFFAKGEPKSGNPAALPSGYSVGTNNRTGLPYLRKA